MRGICGFHRIPHKFVSCLHLQRGLAIFSKTRKKFDKALRKYQIFVGQWSESSGQNGEQVNEIITIANSVSNSFFNNLKLSQIIKDMNIFGSFLNYLLLVGSC